MQISSNAAHVVNLIAPCRCHKTLCIIEIQSLPFDSQQSEPEVNLSFDCLPMTPNGTAEPILGVPFSKDAWELNARAD